MNNITIGRILTTIEALHSRRVKMLIDRSQGRRELWRNIRELIEYDNIRTSLALQGEVYFISFYNIFEGRVFGGQKI
jgi:hypothetical protein